MEHHKIKCVLGSPIYGGMDYEQFELADEVVKCQLKLYVVLTMNDCSHETVQ